MYVNVCVYMYLPRRELYPYLYLYPYPYPSPFPSLPTYQAFLNPYTINKKKQAPASIDHCFLFFPSPPRPARVRVCMCIYMNLWKDSPPCPVLFELRPVRPPPSPPRKKDVRFGGFAPPPHVMVHHTYSHN